MAVRMGVVWSGWVWPGQVGVVYIHSMGVASRVWIVMEGFA